MKLLLLSLVHKNPTLRFSLIRVGFFCLAVAISMLPFPAVSFELSPSSGAELRVQANKFTSYVARSDMAAILNFLPPKILEQYAVGGGSTVEEVKRAAVSEMDEVLKMVRIDDFAMDTKNANPVKLSDGTIYVLFPTKMRMTIDGTTKAVSSSETLAIEENERWYFLRVDKPAHVESLRKAYPAFAEVEFKPGTMEFLEQ